MPQNGVSDSIERRLYRVLLLAQKSSDLSLLVGQLEGLVDCVVEQVESLADAQSALARETPDVVFIDCPGYRASLPEVTGLFRAADDSNSPGAPRLVGIGGHSPVRDIPRACGLDACLPLPTGVDELKALFEAHSRGGGDLRSGENAGHARQGWSISEAVSQLPEDVRTAMLSAFVDYTSVRFDRIASGLEDFELRRVERDVHAVKSGCLQLGLTPMVGCCEELDRAIENNDVGTARSCFKMLRSTFDAIAAELPRH